jgi:hypothetical protein
VSGGGKVTRGVRENRTDAIESLARDIYARWSGDVSFKVAICGDFALSALEAARTFYLHADERRAAVAAPPSVASPHVVAPLYVPCGAAMPGSPGITCDLGADHGGDHAAVGETLDDVTHWSPV